MIITVGVTVSATCRVHGTGRSWHLEPGVTSFDPGSSAHLCEKCGEVPRVVISYSATVAER